MTEQRVGGEVGGSARLECDTAAHPPALNFWKKDDGRTYISPKYGKTFT